MNSLNKLFRLLRPEKKAISRIYVYAVFIGLVQLTIPLGVQALVSFIMGGQLSSSFFVLASIVVAGIAFSGFLLLEQQLTMEGIQQRLFTRASFEFAYRIPRVRHDSVDKQYLPEMVNRFFDTLSVQKGLSKILIDFSSAAFLTIIGLILLVLYHPIFLVFGIGLLTMLIVLIRLTAVRGLQTSLTESKYKYEVVHWLEEVARCLPTFKMAAGSDLPMHRTDEWVGKYLGARSEHFKVLRMQTAWFVVFQVLVTGVLLVLGGWLVMNQSLNLGQFVAAEIVVILIIGSIEKLIRSMETIYDVLTSVEKLAGVTDLPLDEERRTDSPVDHTTGIAVEARNLALSFSGREKPVFNKLNFLIEKGEKVCLTGPGGSGKSTLMRVLAGLQPGYQGNLLFDELPLANIPLAWHRSRVGSCLSIETIFKGTLAENISLGREGISLLDVVRAAETCELKTFADSLENGWDSLLSPEGRSLPQSVVRRIILARAIVHKPQLLLIEGELPNLSPEERQRLIRALTGPQAPWSLIWVSRDADVLNACHRTITIS